MSQGIGGKGCTLPQKGTGFRWKLTMYRNPPEGPEPLGNAASQASCVRFRLRGVADVEVRVSTKHHGVHLVFKRIRSCNCRYDVVFLLWTNGFPLSGFPIPDPRRNRGQRSGRRPFRQVSFPARSSISLRMQGCP